jgi:hypothetical protein
MSAWHVARRILGIYFVVTGLLQASNAIAMIGIVVPEGSSTRGYISAAVVQGIVSIGAGLLLLWNRFPLTVDEPSRADISAMTRMALQLIGVYFLVIGGAGTTRFVVDLFVLSGGWTVRGSQLAEAAVELAAGVLLATRASMIVSRLK